MSVILTEAPQWTEVERPTGPFETPAWCGDVHVDWMLGWCTWPHLKFKQVAPFPEMGPWKREVLDGGKVRWICASADGTLVEQYWHSGALTPRGDGELETTKQDGFGGRTFTLDRVEGITGKVHLRGPWWGGTPDGYTEMTSVDMTQKSDASPHYAYLRGTPWHKRGGTFGFYIREDLLIKLLSRFLPHLPLARVLPYPTAERPHVEPYDPSWGCPKRFRPNPEPGE